MRLLLLLLLCVAGPAVAAEVVVRDGDTLQVGATVYRLAGVDAPEIDQPCLDEHADGWTCGVEARERLAKLVNRRDVRCEDVGEDRTFKTRRAGLCTVAGETTSLNRQMIDLGYGIGTEPAPKAGAKADFRAAATTAMEAKLGLWRGCFVAPGDFRSGAADGMLLGASCPTDKEKALRAALFPDELPKPSGCNIRAKQVRRAKLTGNVGVYLIPQCRNYATQPRPDRWFCSEDDARAAGYRLAFNCQASGGRK